MTWLLSKFYDKMMKDAEEKGLRDWRETLLKNISGDVLELGGGTGANVEFYPSAVKRLVVIEPNPYMQQKLKEKISPGKFFVEILNDKAESLSLPDASFDVVISTLTLCSVDNLEKALSEVHRVLRPHGKLIFIEHVAASQDSKRYRWQRRLEFLWKLMMGGCHTTRRTDEAISLAGFKIMEISRQSMRGVPPIVRPSIRGIAIKT